MVAIVSWLMWRMFLFHVTYILIFMLHLFSKYFQNISTIKNKLTIVEIIIEELKNNFVIIALSETKKVDSNIIIRFKKDWEIEIVNPKLNKCGGLIILIKKGITYKIEEQYYINEISVDEMWLKITKMIIQI